MEAYEDRANEAEKKSDIGLLEEINKDIQEISMEIDTLENKKDNPAITTYESAVNSYDISTNEKTAKYFPAIQSQGSVKGSCVSFSVCYYMFSYEANKLNDINSKILANCYSPEWGHVNFKNNQSSIYSGLKNMGCLKWNEFLYSDNGDLTLTEASEEELLNALKTRASGQMNIVYMGYLDGKTNKYIVNSNTAQIEIIKQLLREDKVLHVSTNADWDERKTSNNEVIIVRAGSKPNRGHALTVVGYDDNIWCDVNKNGKKDAGEVGAFKVANSWGTGYGNKGFYWVLYDALYSSSEMAGFSESSYKYSRVPALGVKATVFSVKNYKPNVIAKVEFKNLDVNKTRVSWGNTSGNIYQAENVLLNDKMNPTDYTMFMDYDTMADTVDEVIGVKRYNIKIMNRASDDTSAHFSSAKFSLVDNKNNTLNSLKSNITRLGTYSTCTYLYLGDTNYSRQIDKEDASFILNVALGINDSNNSSYLQLMLSDYNQDGVVNLQDSQEVLKKANSSN